MISAHITVATLLSYHCTRLLLTAAHSFRRYHLEHHSHQGVIGTDMDLPPWFDVVTVRNCTLRKLLWMSGFMFSYGLRPMGWGRTKATAHTAPVLAHIIRAAGRCPLDSSTEPPAHICNCNCCCRCAQSQLASGWEVVNIVLQLAVNAAMGLRFGPAAPAYMFCSTLLCFGVHPCAAHFIQEHFTLGTSAHAEDHPQETFSYYGPLNKVRAVAVRITVCTLVVSIEVSRLKRSVPCSVVQYCCVSIEVAHHGSPGIGAAAAVVLQDAASSLRCRFQPEHCCCVVLTLHHASLLTVQCIPHAVNVVDGSQCTAATYTEAAATSSNAAVTTDTAAQQSTAAAAYSASCCSDTAALLLVLLHVPLSAANLLSSSIAYASPSSIILNVGYHNEHHDFSKVPWTRLPEIKAAAPEYYNNLYYHTSVFAILLDFLRREDQGPHSRIARTKDAHQ
eukprot:3311-Heterococcus_DN1.PRE.2